MRWRRNTKRSAAEVLARFSADEQAAQQALQDAHWEAMEASDAARGGLNLPLNELLAGLDSRWQELANIHQQAVDLLQRRGHWDDFPEAPPTDVILEKHPGRRFCHALEQAQAQFRSLSKQSLPQLFQGLRPLGIVLSAVGAGGRSRRLPCSVGRTGAGRPSAAASPRWSRTVAGALDSTTSPSGNPIEAYLALRQTLLEAGLGQPAVLEAAKAECQRLDATIIARHKTQTQKADETYAAAMARIERRKQDDLQQADGTYPQRLADLAAWRDRTLQGDRGEVSAPAPPDRRALPDRVGAARAAPRPAPSRRAGSASSASGPRWPSAGGRAWSGSARRPRKSSAACREAFPDWNTDDWSRWTHADGDSAGHPLRRQSDQAGRDQRRRARGRAASARADSSSRCRWCCPIPGVRCCC